MGKKLSDEAVKVLGSMVIADDENLAVFTSGQMDRKLYLECAAALESVGGKWNRKRKGFVFDGSPDEALDQVVLDGEISDAKKEFQAFFTPPPLAALLAARAELKPGMTVLEPSAGEGALVQAALDALPASGLPLAEIFMVECQVVLVDRLAARFMRGDRAERMALVQGDFLEYSIKEGERFDRVIMNPPFARQQDIAHVSRALGMLKPDGKLVAIMSAGTAFRENRRTAEFKQLLRKHGGELQELPEGSFAASGTQVRTLLLTAWGAQ